MGTEKGMTKLKNDERRKQPRVCFDDGHSLDIFTEAATPIDISASGVMLEVSRPLRGLVKGLRLDLGSGGKFDLQGRITRHYVHRFEASDDGRTIVKYRVAIEFVNVEEEVAEVLRSYCGSAATKELTEDLGVVVDYEGLDRRNERRIDASSVRTGQVAFLIDFDILQLSSSGMFVRLTTPLPVGSLHPFALTVGGHPIEVQGEVVHCTKPGRGEGANVYSVAIAFRGLSEDDKELLEQYVVRTLAEREVAGPQETA